MLLLGVAFELPMQLICQGWDRRELGRNWLLPPSIFLVRIFITNSECLGWMEQGLVSVACVTCFCESQARFKKKRVSMEHEIFWCCGWSGESLLRLLLPIFRPEDCNPGAYRGGCGDKWEILSDSETRLWGLHETLRAVP